MRRYVTPKTEPRDRSVVFATRNQTGGAGELESFGVSVSPFLSLFLSRLHSPHLLLASSFLSTGLLTGPSDAMFVIKSRTFAVQAGA
jgi:hypothetical protein